MSSAEPNVPSQSEEGDYIINWHLQYVTQILLQGNLSLLQLSSNIKLELSKIRSDFEFIKKHHAGPHKNLLKLKATDRELLALLDKISEAADQMRKLSTATAKRIT